MFFPHAASALLIVSGVIMGAGPATAAEHGELVQTSDLEVIRSIAEGYGEAELVELDNGDSAIAGEINGASYQLFLLGCDDDGICEALNFYAIWDVPTVATAALNAWNRTEPFNKAYLTEDNLPVIEMNIPARAGFPAAQLEFAFDRWTIALAEFPRSVLDGAP